MAKGRGLWTAVLVMLVAISTLGAEHTFIRGDFNADGIVSMADVVRMKYYLFKLESSPPPCLLAGDANFDQWVDIADPAATMTHLLGLYSILSVEEAPPEFPNPMTCLQNLVGSPALDSGIVVFMDDVVVQGDEVRVPIRVSGAAGALHAWQFRITFPPESLAFVSNEIPVGPDLPLKPWSANVEQAGIVRVCGLYWPHGEGSYAGWWSALEVGEGTKLAELVFQRVGTATGRAELGFVNDYGTAELVFDPEQPTVFPSTSGSVVLFDSPPLSPPTQLVAQVDGAEVALAWHNQATHEAVVVERNEQILATLPGTTTSYRDAPPSGEHGYRVRAAQGARRSTGPFASASVWRLPAPGGVTVTTPSYFTTSVRWTNGGTYDQVRVFRGGTLLAVLPGDSTEYVDTSRDGPIVVYHVQGLSGQNFSVRAAGLYVEPTSGPFTEFGEAGVTDLDCRFTAPGDVLVSWTGVPGADGYEVARLGEVIANVDAGTTQFSETPPFVRRDLPYEVTTMAGGRAIARRNCALAYLPSRSVILRQPVVAGDLQSVLLPWSRQDVYIGLAVLRDGAPWTTLAGDATSLVHEFADGVPVTYAVLAYGERFVTSPAQVTLTSPHGQLLRGDANWDGRVSIADALFLRRYLNHRTAGETPSCLDAADADDSGSLDMSDAFKVLDALFAFWNTDVMLPEPYPVPGYDLTNDQLTCEVVDILPGELTQDLLRIGEVEAAPGEEIAVPVYISNSVPIEACQLVVRYPPELFTPGCGGGSSCRDLEWQGTAWNVINGMRPDFSALLALPGDDYLVAGILYSYLRDAPLPPGNDQLLAYVVGRVSDAAIDGQMIELAPDNGPEGNGLGVHRMRNEITQHGESRYVALYPATKEGRIVVRDNPMGMDYLRGDVNASRKVDIADPIALLSHLFARGAAPRCPDAADANDDGALDIADAITILQYLFARGDGGGSVVSLIGTCGYDLTPDRLGACIEPSCSR